MGKLELIFETEKLSIYSPKYDGETQTEFEKFLDANRKRVHSQLKACFGAILSAIDIIRRNEAYERYFRLEGGRIKAVPLFYNFQRIDKKVGKNKVVLFEIIG